MRSCPSIFSLLFFFKTFLQPSAEQEQKPIPVSSRKFPTQRNTEGTCCASGSWDTPALAATAWPPHHRHSPTLKVTSYPHFSAGSSLPRDQTRPSMQIQTHKHKTPHKPSLKINTTKCQTEGGSNKVLRVQSAKHQRSSQEYSLYNLPTDNMYSFNFFKCYELSNITAGKRYQ